MPTTTPRKAAAPSTPPQAPDAPQEATAAPQAPTVPPTIVQALSAVSKDVGAVGKDRQAPGNIGGFMFRGVDAVVNAVHPALARHGVVLLPNVLSREAVTVPTRQGGTMVNVTVLTRFTFYGPAGDSLSVTTYGEAADAGDKATTKAQSVALRVALLQALMLPTDEPDPDEQGYERAGQPQQQQTQQQQPTQPEQARPQFSAPDPEARPKAASAWQAIQVLDEAQAERVRAAYPQGWPHPTSLDEGQAERLLGIMRNLFTDSQEVPGEAPDPT